MNVEAIKIVRDVIAALPEKKFNMNRFVGRLRSDGDPEVIDTDDLTAGSVLRECGTCGCIAGWAVATVRPRTRTSNVERAGAEILGLDERTASALFMPPHVNQWSAIKPKHAVAVLDHLLETGEVNWSIIAEPVAS